MKDKETTQARWLVGIIFTLLAIWNIFIILVNIYSQQSYESGAIGNLRTLVGSQKAFKHAEGGYASTWKELCDAPVAARKPAYLDIDLSGAVQGYAYTLKSSGRKITGTSGTTVYTDFICTAVPVKYKKGSKRSFYVDSIGVIRFEFSKMPTIESEPI